MNVLWLSVRRFGKDLCGTTQIALLDKISQYSEQVEIWARGEYEPSQNWGLVSFPDDSKIGFQTKNLAKHFLLSEQDFSKFQHVLIDWPLVRYLGKKVNEFESWSLIDRSPPADKGIFSKLQWRDWKFAWKKYRDSENSKLAMVVSREHEEFVKNKIGKSVDNITIVNAGVDINKFNSSNHRSMNPLKLVYHGRLDVHRGVLSLPFISHILDQKGIKHELHLIGNGNASTKVGEMIKDNESIYLHDSMTHDEISRFLQGCHIGCLPMPSDYEMWKISSPLKLSEYLSSGLLVVGIDHTGNRFDEDLKSIYLEPKESFIKGSAEWIKSVLDDGNFAELSQLSRKFAENNLDWNLTTTEFISRLLNQ